MPSTEIWLRGGAVGMAAALVAAALGVSGAYGYYRGRFAPGSRVGDIRLGGLTRSQGDERVREAAEAYGGRTVTVAVAGQLGQTKAVSATAGELGAEFDPVTLSETAWRIGRDGSPASRLRALLSPRPVPFFFVLRAEGVRTFLDTKVAGAVTPPVPASVAIREGRASITEGVSGSAVPLERLAARLAAALSEPSEAPLAVRAEALSVPSPVSPASLVPTAVRWNALGDLPLTLVGSDGRRFTPDRLEKMSWFAPVQDAAGRISLAVQWSVLSEYLDARRTVRTDSALPLLAAALQPLLAAELPDRLSVPVPSAVAAERPGAAELGLDPGKYVLVSLKEQKLYTVEGQRLVKTYRVSTGKWSTPTPVGTFAIRDKVPRAYSRTHGLYMPYWENFVGTSEGGDQILTDGEYGLHELPEWPNGYKEGAAHLGTPVSHGCVRLGPGDAAEVYAWTDIGTPVIIR